MIHLASLRLRGEPRDEFPFNLPVVSGLEHLSLEQPVTFLVGENGSGKSTLLEAVAVAAGSITVGGQDVSTDPTLSHSRELGRRLVLSWRKKTRRGFFMRAEDFFGFAARLRATVAELEGLEEEFDEAYTGYGRQLAVGSARGQRLALVERYGEDLAHLSHGEAFLRIFQERFVPAGLYLLDEPEAPLSPQRQLTLIALLMSMVDQGAQFLIATHSPLLMAFPEAVIYCLDESPPRATPFAEVDHVRMTRDFLACPERYLRHL